MERGKSAIGPAGTEEFQSLGLRGRGEGEGRNVGWLPPSCHLRQCRIVQVFVLRRWVIGVLGFGLFQGRGGQHVPGTLGSLTRLGGMGLIHYQSKSLTRQLANFLGNHREFLQGGNDDGLARYQRFFELPGGSIDVLHYTQGLLKLPHRRLELTVQYTAVGNHHDGVEDAAVFRIVEGGQLMGQPGNSKGLAAPRRVLDQVSLPRSPLPGVSHQLPHAVQLLVAGKDQEALAGLPSPIVFLLHLVDELAYEIQHTVPLPSLLPKVGSGVAALGRRNGRVAGAAELALIEGKEISLRSCNLRGHIDQIGINGEVGQASAIVKERLPRVPVCLVLANGILDRLPRERVLELCCENRNAVEKES